MRSVLVLLALISFPIAAAAQSLNYVTTNSSLQMYPVTGLSAGYPLADTGYYTAGDMPTVTYTLSTSSCPAADGGSQVPSSTTGYCWKLSQQTQYDVRTWGAVPGGGDPHGNNATQINAAITYVGGLGTTGQTMPTLTGGGLLYAVEAPVILNENFLRFYGFSFMPFGTLSIPCNSALVEVTGADVLSMDHIQINLEEQAINGFLVATDGTLHFDNIIVQHWEGACASVPLTGVATTTNGSNVVVMTSTAGLATGMVSRGNSAIGIQDRAVIVDINSSSTPYTITLSKPAIASTAGANVTFYTDANGIALGLGGANTGGTYSNINSYEWKAADTYSSNPAYRYGYPLLCASGCNDVSINHGVLISGISPIYLDKNSGTLKVSGVEIDNNLWSPNETNPPCIIMAADSGILTVADSAENGCSTQTYITDSYTPTAILSAIRYTSSSESIISPSGLAQIWTDQTGANAGQMSIDSFNASLSSSLAPWAIYGPGTFATFPNTTPYSGSLLNYTQGDEAYSSSTNLGYGDCGYSIRINNGTTPVTIGLPPVIPNVNYSNSCVMRIFVNGTGAVTLKPVTVGGLTGLLNGSASGIQLAQNVGYSVWSVGEPACCSGALGWTVDNIGVFNTLSVAGSASINGALEPNAGIISGGTKFSASGCSTGITVGGADAGTFKTNTASSCSVTITINGATGATAPNGWSCPAWNETHPSNTFTETSSTMTTVTFSGTPAAVGDIIGFECRGY